MGNLLVFLAFFGRLFGPIRGVGWFATSISSASASAERITEVTEPDPSVQGPAVTICVRGFGALALNAVPSSYPGQAKPALLLST